MDTIERYAAVFWRPPGVVREPENGVNVRACMFPPLRRSFWKGLMAEAHDVTVYVTAGLSDFEMPVPAHLKKEDPARVELFVTCPVPIGGGPGGAQDVPTVMIQKIAGFIVERKAAVSVGHTLDFGERWSTNTAMSAVLFAGAEGVDARRICKCSRAQALLTPVPITQSELEFARREGVLALVDKFEAARVPVSFDVFRKSVV